MLITNDIKDLTPDNIFFYKKTVILHEYERHYMDTYCDMVRNAIS